MTTQDFSIKWLAYTLALLPVWFLDAFFLSRFPVFGVRPMLLPLCAAAVATLEGASAGVELCLSMAGVLCLWMGVMEVMRRSGLSEGLSRLLRPVLKRLYPDFAGDRKVMDTVSANVSANLLGLGNAATPLGLEAARLMAERSPGIASDSLCMLVVCNTASIQLIPTTVASIRAAAGCATPFDILPAVWLASAVALTVGISAAKLFAKIWR